MKRDGKIELLCFLGILFIMCDHMGHIGLGELKRPFTGTWVYVEFFLILSGFMTAKHFSEGAIDQSLGTYISNSVTYTIKKYKRFIPYVACAVILEYIVRYHALFENKEFTSLWARIEEIPAEIMLLSSAATYGTRLFPIWFLSATFLVSPFISIISQIKNKYVKGIITFYPAVFYYLYRVQSIGNHDYPNQIIRAFCGMSLGVFIYLMSEYIKIRPVTKIKKLFLTFWMAMCYCLLLFMGYKGYVFISTYLICFISIIMLNFCGHTFFPNVTSRILSFLGKLSMPMFIWHYVIAHIVSGFVPIEDIYGRILLYYFGTILISVISLLIIQFGSKKIKQSRNAISLY